LALIDIGPGAIDRAYDLSANMTTVDNNNPANDSGSLDTFEFWCTAALGGCKVGTFSGSGASYTNRDYEYIGTVASGSKQTFSGLNCDVVTGDFLGVYNSSGYLELDMSGYISAYYKSGDQFDAGTQTYLKYDGRAISIYGTGATPPPVVVPTVTTQAVSNIGTTTATGHGNVTDNGGENPNDRQIEWGTSSGVYTNSCSAGAGGTGAFSCNLTGLSCGQKYYVRAKAHNSAGWGYGNEVDFTTATIKINIGDTWKDVDKININIGDIWKDVSELWINIGDIWKQIFQEEL